MGNKKATTGSTLVVWIILLVAAIAAGAWAVLYWNVLSKMSSWYHKTFGIDQITVEVGPATLTTTTTKLTGSITKLDFKGIIRLKEDSRPSQIVIGTKTEALTIIYDGTPNPIGTKIQGTYNVSVGKGEIFAAWLQEQTAGEAMTNYCSVEKVLITAV